MRAKYTDELALQAYVIVETTKLTYKEIGEQLGVNGATVANWAKKVAKTPRLKKLGVVMIKKGGGAVSVKKTKTRSSGEGHKSLQSAIDLSNENAFLRWWNLGERQRFVERLLKELGKE